MVQLPSCSLSFPSRSTTKVEATTEKLRMQGVSNFNVYLDPSAVPVVGDSGRGREGARGLKLLALESSDL